MWVTLHLIKLLHSTAETCINGYQMHNSPLSFHCTCLQTLAQALGELLCKWH